MAGQRPGEGLRGHFPVQSWAGHLGRSPACKAGPCRNRGQWPWPHLTTSETTSLPSEVWPTVHRARSSGVNASTQQPLPRAPHWLQRPQSRYWWSPPCSPAAGASSPSHSNKLFSNPDIEGCFRGTQTKTSTSKLPAQLSPRARVSGRSPGSPLALPCSTPLSALGGSDRPFLG